MSETTDQPIITPEMLAAYQRQQAAAEQAAMQAIFEALMAWLAERRVEIVTRPLYTPDGRTVAQWLLRRID